MSQPTSSEMLKAPTAAGVTPLTAHAYARLTGGNPNAGFVVGRDGVVVIDAASTPALAAEQIRDIRRVTDAPIRYVLLTHYHAIRVLGAAAYVDAGAQVVAARGTRALIDERGHADMVSEIKRFPGFFPNADSVRGLIRPTVTFDSAMDVSLGDVEVQLLHLGRGHTEGDAIAWLPEERVCYAGDLVEMEVGVYAGDAHLADWLQSLARLRAMNPRILIPGRGPALSTPADIEHALAYTELWIRTILDGTREALAKGADFLASYAAVREMTVDRFSKVMGYEHCLAYAASRAFDEVRGLPPKIWTEADDDWMRRTLPGVF